MNWTILIQNLNITTKSQNWLKIKLYKKKNGKKKVISKSQ